MGKGTLGRDPFAELKLNPVAPVAEEAPREPPAPQRKERARGKPAPEGKPARSTAVRVSKGRARREPKRAASGETLKPMAAAQPAPSAPTAAPLPEPSDREVVDSRLAQLPPEVRPTREEQGQVRALMGELLQRLEELLSRPGTSALRDFVRALRMLGHSDIVDEFGYDPVYDALWRPVTEFLYERYWRVRTVGLESVPDAGRLLLVANHSGTLPLDGAMIRHALQFKRQPPRVVRFLAEDFFSQAPFLAPFLARTGSVRACQENALRLLAQEQCVGVFPEGVKGIGKPFRERYKLQRFGRGGFVRVALKAQAPIVPVAVVGAEESIPILGHADFLGQPLGLPFFPVTPFFPWLGPLGLLPLPTRWSIHFGPRMDLSPYGPEDAQNEVVVTRLAQDVRDAIQQMLDRAVAERRSIWLG
jgi:1-acyl-sn-glycerol-3-phosphate acyltransferase